jgi:Family of unknown function (DUF5681)
MKSLMRNVPMSKRKLNGGEPRREKRDYEVGYGKPPKTTRFQPGHSGRKGRRRKRSTTVGMDVKKGLNGKVAIRNGDGEPIKMTEREFVVASLIQRAMKGDMAAIKLVVKLDREAELVDRAAAPEFQEFPSEPIEFVWTEEQKKLHQELKQAIEEAEREQNDAEQV